MFLHSFSDLPRSVESSVRHPRTLKAVLRQPEGNILLSLNLIFLNLSHKGAVVQAGSLGVGTKMAPSTMRLAWSGEERGPGHPKVGVSQIGQLPVMLCIFFFSLYP